MICRTLDGLVGVISHAFLRCLLVSSCLLAGIGKFFDRNWHFTYFISQFFEVYKYVNFSTCFQFVPAKLF